MAIVYSVTPSSFSVFTSVQRKFGSGFATYRSSAVGVLVGRAFAYAIGSSAYTDTAAIHTGNHRSNSKRDITFPLRSPIRKDLSLQAAVSERFVENYDY
jgi:hypothetical protein